MEHNEVSAAIGHEVRVMDGVKPYVGILSDAQRDYLDVGAWGASVRKPQGWNLVIDGRQVTVPESAELEVLD